MEELDALRQIEQNNHPPSPFTEEFDFDDNIDILKLEDLDFLAFNKIDRIDYFLLQEFLEAKYKENQVSSRI